MKKLHCNHIVKMRLTSLVAFVSHVALTACSAFASEPMFRVAFDGGADAVVELPFPYAAASAEYFARAGVDILSRLGVGELWFGSECGDLARLARLAELADSTVFRERYESMTVGNAGTARAYFDCLCELAGEDASCLSNDILAISYLRAIKTLGASITPVTVKREGSRYLDDTIGDGFPSATALRRKWREGGLAAILPHLPRASAEVLMRERIETPADLRYAERLILGHFRLTSVDALECCAELSGGLGTRMAGLADRADTLDKFLALCATKKYPNARLRRGILFALTGVAQHEIRLVKISAVPRSHHDHLFLRALYHVGTSIPSFWKEYLPKRF